MCFEHALLLFRLKKVCNYALKKMENKTLVYYDSIPNRFKDFVE